MSTDRLKSRFTRHMTRRDDRCPLETSYGTGNPTTYCRGLPYKGEVTRGEGWCLDHLLEYGYVKMPQIGQVVIYNGRAASILEEPQGSYYNASADHGGPLIRIQVIGDDRPTVAGLNDLVLS